MSYYTQSLLAADQNILLRATACAAIEGEPNAQGWAWEHAWRLSAQPDWDAAYASALENDVEHPGRDGSVISDPMILAAVQAIRSSPAD